MLTGTSHKFALTREAISKGSTGVRSLVANSSRSLCSPQRCRARPRSGLRTRPAEHPDRAPKRPAEKILLHFSCSLTGLCLATVQSDCCRGTGLLRTDTNCSCGPGNTTHPHNQTGILSENSFKRNLLNTPIVLDEGTTFPRCFSTQTKEALPVGSNVFTLGGIFIAGMGAHGFE